MANVPPKVKGALGVLGVVAVNDVLKPAAKDVVMPVITKAVDVAGDVVDDIRERKIVPQLYSPKFQMTTEQAIKELESSGFKAESHPILKTYANKKYRDCIVNQVIDTDPKAHTPIKPEKTVHVLYATQEFIDESIRLAEEYDREVAERKEKAKQAAADAADIAVQVAANAAGKLKQAKDKLPKMPKKKGAESAELNEPIDVIEAVELSETVETIEE